MKNLLKHTCLLSVLIILMIGGCKKNGLSDFRDAIAGTYTGIAYHNYQSGPSPGGNSSDSVGPLTLSVAKTGDSSIVINGTDVFSLTSADSNSIIYDNYAIIGSSVGFAANFDLQGGKWHVDYYYNNTGTGLHPDYYSCRATKQ